MNERRLIFTCRHSDAVVNVSMEALKEFLQLSCLRLVLWRTNCFSGCKLLLVLTRSITESAEHKEQKFELLLGYEQAKHSQTFHTIRLGQRVPVLPVIYFGECSQKQLSSLDLKLRLKKGCESERAFASFKFGKDSGEAMF